MTSMSQHVPDSTPTAQGQVISSRTTRYGPPPRAHRFGIWPFGVLSATVTFSVLMIVLWQLSVKSYTTLLVQRETERQREKTDREDLEQKLRTAVNSPPHCSLPPPVPPPAPPPLAPLFRERRLRENELLLSLGYRFCGVKYGNPASEQAFKESLVTLNPDNVSWNGKNRIISRSAQLNIVHEGELWRFPTTCRPRIDNVTLKPSSTP